MNGKVIRSRAPLRIGIAGGGTDVDPYASEKGGVILNSTIDKYAYCTISPAAPSGETSPANIFSRIGRMTSSDSRWSRPAENLPDRRRSF